MTHIFTDKLNTQLKTLIHLIKCCLGTGILAMPHAFQKAGLTVGTVCCVLIGVMCTYCLHILVRAQYVLCKRLKTPLLTYPESMKVGLEQGPEKIRFMSRFAAPTVDFFIIVHQLGICCVYNVFLAENIKKIVDPYKELDVRIWLVIILLPLIAINLIRSLKILAPFSVVANLTTFVSLIIIYYFVFYHFPSPSTRPHYGTNILGYPLYFGTVLFAVEAVGIIIALENNMKTPKSFRGWFGVLNIGMGTITLLYAFTGFVGLVKYGDDIKPSITLNLGPGVAATSVLVLTIIAIFISHALQGFVPVDILWRSYLKKRIEKHELAWEYGMRVAVVILTLIIAAAVPHLGIVISLVGAFCLSMLGFAFPALLELCVNHTEPKGHGKFKWILVKDIAIMIFGVIGMLCGTYSASFEIVKKSIEDAHGNSSVTTIAPNKTA